MSDKTTVTLRQQENYHFSVEFGQGLAVLETDEAPPLGGGRGPTPVQLLAAAVGNCLSDSLHFALTKFKQDAGRLETTSAAEVDRNAEGRLRVKRIDVTVRLGAAAADLAHLDRVLGQFERFCIVAQSVGQGLPVEVAVLDASGVKLK